MAGKLLKNYQLKRYFTGLPDEAVIMKFPGKKWKMFPAQGSDLTEKTVERKFKT